MKWAPPFVACTMHEILDIDSRAKAKIAAVPHRTKYFLRASRMDPRSPVYLSACLLPVLRLTPRQFVTPRESLKAILLLLEMSDCPETKKRLRRKKINLKLYLNLFIATIAKKFCKKDIVNSINIEDKTVLRGVFLIIQIKEKILKESEKNTEKRLYMLILRYIFSMWQKYI